MPGEAEEAEAEGASAAALPPPRGEYAGRRGGAASEGRLDSKKAHPEAPRAYDPNPNPDPDPDPDH